MTQRLSAAAAALMLALLVSNAAAAQPLGIGLGYYQHPCFVWDGYRWLNICWRPRTFVRPAWARFHR
jgi:hypothetical protein